MNRKIFLQMFLFLFCFFFTACATMGHVLRHDTDIDEYMGLVIGDAKDFHWCGNVVKWKYIKLKSFTSQKSNWYPLYPDNLFAIVLPTGTYRISVLKGYYSLNGESYALNVDLEFSIFPNQCTEIGRIIYVSEVRRIFAGDYCVGIMPYENVYADTSQNVISSIRNKFCSKFPNLYKKFFGDTD